MSGVRPSGSPVLTRIDVSANCSLTLRAAVVFYASIAVASLAVASLFVWQGYWPVLPFTGLELFLLGLALGLSMRRGRYQEAITISDDRVVIEKTGRGRDTREDIPRLWARVEMYRPRRRNHPSRLLVISHGNACEVGGSLTEEDRQGLGRRLAQLIGGTGEAPALGHARGAGRE
jgi:uncharacterized membrane protein